MIFLTESLIHYCFFYYPALIPNLVSSMLVFWVIRTLSYSQTVSLLTCDTISKPWDIRRTVREAIHLTNYLGTPVLQRTFETTNSKPNRTKIIRQYYHLKLHVVQINKGTPELPCSPNVFCVRRVFEKAGLPSFNSISSTGEEWMRVKHSKRREI